MRCRVKPQSAHAAPATCVFPPPAGVNGLPDMAPLCVKERVSRLEQGAPVLAGIKQRTLDAGCGSALVEGGGNGLKNGLPGGFGAA
jgi:hypothetical protein